MFPSARMARRPGWLPCTLGAHSLRLPHLFQKYVSPDTSAFRYAVRSAVRGALSLTSLSFLLGSALPLPSPHPHPARQLARPCPLPSRSQTQLDRGACEQPPQAGRRGRDVRVAGGGAGASHHLTGWSGCEASRPPGANEHCRTGVCSSVPSLPCLRPEPAACHPSKAPSHPRALPRPGPGGRDGLPLLRRWLQQP